MRWKLKDLLAESVHPVPEKASLADLSSCENQKGLARVEKQQNKIKLRPNKLKTETVKQNRHIVTSR